MEVRVTGETHAGARAAVIALARALRALAEEAAHSVTTERGAYR